MISKKRMLGCALAIFWGGAVSFGYPGVMTLYWQERFGVGAGDVQAVTTFMLLALAASMFFSGRIHQKIGIFYCFLIGTVLYAATFLTALLATRIEHIYLWGLFANLSLSFIYGPGLTTCQTAVPEKRGLVSGVLNLVFGLAAAVTSPLMNAVLSHLGERALNGMLLAVILLTDVAALLLVRGDTPVYQSASKTESRTADHSVSQALHSRLFRLMWLVWAFVGAAGITMISLSKTYSVAVGIAGVTVLTAFNLANGGIRIAAGALSDRIGGTATALLFYSLATVALFVFPFVRSTLAVCLCAAAVGMAFGTLFTVSGPILSGTFGVKNFGAIYGLVFTGYGVVGAFLGPAVVGRLLDGDPENFVSVFWYLGAICALGTFCMLRLHVCNRRN